MYFMKTVTDDLKKMKSVFIRMSRTNQIVLVAILSGIAAVFQSAGGYLPIIGFFISPLATAPILLCTIISFSFGILAYVVTIFLLFILQPTELIVFPFTTGLLGVGLGISFSLFKKRLSIIINGAIVLTIGIGVLLYIIKFPVLGPVVSSTFSFSIIVIVFLFSFFYSWFWVEIGIFCFKKLKGFILS